MATCKKKSIGKFHSSLRSYSFKKQFLIMKGGKFSIYEMKVKDNVDLSEFEIKQEQELDILPQTNPFVFTLGRLDNHRVRELNTNFMRDSLVQETEEDWYTPQQREGLSENYGARAD